MRTFGAKTRGKAILAIFLLTASTLSPWELRAQDMTDSEAAKLLEAATSYLAGLNQYSVDIHASYDTLQSSGQMIEFGEKHRLVMARPDHLRVEVEESNGIEHLLVFDGNILTYSTPRSQVFAQTSIEGSIDQAVVYFVRDLGMRLPLAVLMLSTAPQELAVRTVSLDYVEKTSILGKPAHHLAGRTESVDYQIWIADGGQPLILRVVLSYRGEEGHPQYRAHLSNWNVAPEIQDSAFAFSPSPESTKITFLSEVQSR